MGGMLSPLASLETAPLGQDVKEGEGQQERGGADELELMYDPQLNCFYDPGTCKYYELIQP